MTTEQTVHVRYLVDDVQAAVDFYTTHLGFEPGAVTAPPAFADVRRGNLRLLVAAPTIILRHEHAIPIVKRNGRVHHATGKRNAAQAQTRSLNADNGSLGDIALDDETADHRVISREHMSSGGNIAEARRRCSGVEIVDFHESHASGVVGPAHNRGVTAGRECRDESRIQIVARSEPGGDQRRLLRTAPVIVAGHDCPCGVA